MTTATMTPATPKQVVLINKLLSERDTCGTPYAHHVLAPAHLNTRQASDAITALLALPKPQIGRGKVSKTDGVEPGVYMSDGHLFRVYLGQQSGTMLVKSVEIDEGVEYHYLGSASRCLPADARRLSVDEVGALGKTSDHCLMCGRRLDDPESVDRGIGPVCAAKY